MSAERTLVVPCYNEAARLDVGAWSGLASQGMRLVLVDDGSSDGTEAVLQGIARSLPQAVRVIRLPRNRGKGEAVRLGLLAALEGAELVGYADADLSTPTHEVARLFDELATRPELGALIGSRIHYMGTRIERRAVRHYLGRVFATGAATALGRPIYDTQCGAKVFRVGAELRAALGAPFVSRWAFDVELLARLFEEGARVEELPLREWVHVGGSKLRPLAMLRASADLARIGLRVRRRR